MNSRSWGSEISPQDLDLAIQLPEVLQISPTGTLRRAGANSEMIKSLIISFLYQNRPSCMKGCKMGRAWAAVGYVANARATAGATQLSAQPI